MPVKLIWYLLTAAMAMAAMLLYYDEMENSETQKLHHLYEQIFSVNESILRIHLLLSDRHMNDAREDRLPEIHKQTANIQQTLDDIHALMANVTPTPSVWASWHHEAESYLQHIESTIQHPRDAADGHDALEGALQKNQQFADHITHILKQHNGRSEWIHNLLLLLAVFFTVALVGYIHGRERFRQREIHLIQQARSKAQQYASRTRILMDATEEAIFGINREGECIFANRSCLNALGYRMESELLGKSMHHHWVIEQQKQPDILEPLRTSARKHRDDECLCRCDGSIFPVAYWSSPLFADGTDKPASGLVVTFFDITEKLENQHALSKYRDINRRLIACVENAREAIMITAIDGTIEYVNPGFAHLTMIPHQQILGQNAHHLFTVELHSDFAWEPLMSGEVREEAGQFRIAGGKVLDVEQHRFPISDEHHQICGYAAMLRDVTQQREEQSKLEHSQRLESLGVLSGGIAHDFNNILTAILGNAALASSQLHNVSQLRQALHQIEQASLRAADLCSQMLAYAGKGRFHMGNVDLSKLIEAMSSLVRVSVSNRIRMQFDLDPALPDVHGDRAQLQQVVLNLLMNASDATAGGNGTVTIRTRVDRIVPADLADQVLHEALAAGDYVCLEVNDDGIGMSENTRLRVFEPFFSTKFTGRGLGMSAVLGIIRAHRGTITVTSEEGKGSCFRVYLPCVKENPRTTKKGAVMHDGIQINDWQPSETLLVIDDEEVIRQTLAMMLGMMGFTVLEAANGSEGIQTYREHQQAISLVILDMTMPDMSGDAVFDELQKIHSDVQVLLSSGYSDAELRPRFAGRGLAGFIQKPFTPQHLKEKIFEVMQAHS